MAASPTPHFTSHTAAACKQHLTADDFDGKNINLAAVLEAVKGKGYAVLRNFLSEPENQACIAELRKDIAACPDATPVAHTDGPPPYVDWDPAVTSGRLQPATREMGVRRLYRIATNNEYFRKVNLRNW